MSRNSALTAALLLLFFLVTSPLALAKDDWLPISPADLALKDNPALPGSAAMILYRSVERNDLMGSEKEYVRIKIFNDEGKKYADVNMPPFDRDFKIGGVSGRTIHPDGSIVAFSGQVFEKVVQKSRGTKVTTKSFTLPDVTPGSIIEYRYTRYWDAYDPATRVYYYFPLSQWQVQGPLFQKATHFEFTPNDPSEFSYRMVGVHMTQNLKPTEDKLKHIITLDMTDVLPVEEEPYSPPEFENQAFVLFFYSTDLRIPEGDEYWKSHGKKWYGQVESFMDKKGAVSSALASVTQPSDSPEVKLHKIYDYVQGFENLTFESRKSEKEAKNLNLREIKSVEDVIKNKYGYRNQLNRTLVALARSAGLDAALIDLPERDELLLHKEWPFFSQLRYEIAVVNLNGKKIFLDPGTPYVPFGILPWEDTGATGLLWSKNMPDWTTVPLPEPADATVSRTAKVTLADDGSLSGEVVVTYTGEEAFRRRFRARNEDDAARKKSMEEHLQNWLPLKGDIELESVNDWNSSNLPLIVKYKINLPGYASQTGHRVLVPSTLFAGAYKPPFTASKRVAPIFMEYEYDHSDDVTISLPKTWQVESLPKPVKDSNAVADLTVNAANDNGALHFSRDFKMKGIALESKYYSALKGYYAGVQAGTNEQAVLKMAN